MSSAPATPRHTGLLDAMVTIAIRVLSAMLVFGLQVLLARLLPLEDYGGFITIWTWMLALGSFAALGFAESSVRFLPRYRARGRERQVQGFFRYGLKAVLVSAVALGGAALIAAQFWGPQTSTGLLVLLVGLGLPFLAIEYYLGGVARSFGWYRLTTIPVYVVRPILIGGTCLGLTLLGVQLTLPLVGAIMVMAVAIIAITVTFLVAHRLRTLAPPRPTPAPQHRLWLRASLPLLLVAGLDDLLTYADVLIISVMLPAGDVGLYFAAARALALANFVTYAMHLVAGRRFSLDLASQSRTELQRSILASTSMTFWMTLLAVAATLVVGPWLLLAFGAEFSAGYGVMVVLGCGMVIRAMAGQAGEVLVVTGRQRESLAIAAATLLANVLMTIALIALFGVIGAAIGTAIAMAGRTLALILVLARTEKLRVVSLALPRLRAA